MVLQRCLLCVLCAPYSCGWAAFAFSPVICNVSFCLLWAGFGLCVVVGQSGTILNLSLVRPGICQRCGRTKLQGTFPVLSPEKFLWVGGAYSHTRCLSPAHYRGHSWTVCVVIFPSSWDRSHFGVVLVPVRAVAHFHKFVAQLWISSGQGYIGRCRSAGKCEGKAHGASKVSGSPLWNGT